MLHEFSLHFLLYVTHEHWSGIQQFYGTEGTQFHEILIYYFSGDQ